MAKVQQESPTSFHQRNISRGHRVEHDNKTVERENRTVQHRNICSEKETPSDVISIFQMSLQTTQQCPRICGFELPTTWLSKCFTIEN